MGRAKDQGGLGFRDLVCFNEVLLAKQCWHLIQFPDSLATKIIKAKYYSSGSFLSVKLGSKPSFAWRSILVGRELLEEGLFWRIGNGNSVQVQGEKLIPLPITYTTQTSNSDNGEDMMVADLLEDNPVQWKKLFIFKNFDEDEATTICNISVSRYEHEDKMIWRALSSREFSVKSAYHLEKECQTRKKGECLKGVSDVAEDLVTKD